MNKENVLRRYKVDKCKWYVEILAYFECAHDFICGMNIYQKDIYILMRDGTVSHIDYRGWPKEVYQLDVSLHNPNTKRFMFNTYSAICVGKISITILFCKLKKYLWNFFYFIKILLHF